MRIGVIGAEVWSAPGRGRIGMSRRRWLAAGLIAAAGFVGAVKIYQWWTTWPARVVIYAAGDHWPLAFSPDGTTLVTAASNGLALWDTNHGNRSATWAYPGGRRVYCAEFTPDGRTLASLSWGGSGPLVLDLIDTATYRVRASVPTKHGGLLGLVVADEGRRVRAVVCSPTAIEVVDCDPRDGRVLADRQLSVLLSSQPHWITRDGRTLAGLFAMGPTSPVPKRDVVLWDLDEDRESARFTGAARADVGSIAFANHGATLAIGRENGSIELWDIAARRLTGTLHGHKADFGVRQLSFTPDDSLLASTGYFTFRRGFATPRALYAMATLLLRGGNKELPCEVVLLDPAAGRSLRHAESETRVVFSPDGRTLASFNLDGTARLRDLPSSPRKESR